MKFTALAIVAGSAAVSASAPDYLAKQTKLPELTKANAMSTLKQLKLSQRDASRAAGLFDENRYESMKAESCANGSIGEYSCGNTDLVGSLTHGDMGSSDREGNDIWGEF